MPPERRNAGRSKVAPVLIHLLFFSIAACSFIEKNAHGVAIDRHEYILQQISIGAAQHLPGDLGLGDVSKVFASVPVAGYSQPDASYTSSTTAYLMNGLSEELTASYVFRPRQGETVDNYTITFECDAATVVVPPEDCDIVHTEAEVVAENSVAYNTTVTCAFSRFPGSTRCALIAAGEDVTFESDPTTFNVFGVVFYTPDANGDISPNATIVSGEGNSYALTTFDTTDQGVRKISTYGLLPSTFRQDTEDIFGTETSGSFGLSFMQSGTVTADIADQLFNYDFEDCTFLTSAEFSNEGAFLLTESSTCGIGLAVADEDSFPELGIQFRVYKSGRASFSIEWPALAPDEESYEQVITIEVAGDAPPILTAVDNTTERFRSVPCASEFIELTLYNVQGADSLYMLVDSENGTEPIWYEVPGSAAYNSTSDTSNVQFESAGGIGTDRPFIVRAVFDEEEREALVLENEVNATLSFTFAPTITNMEPSETELTGGDPIVLTGNFQSFGEDGTVSVGGYELNASSVELVGTTQITFLSPNLEDLGRSYEYDVFVANCAESSNNLTLTYKVVPQLTISAVDASPSSDNIYIVPFGGTLEFFAEVTGGNGGLTYAWSLFDSGDDPVALGTQYAADLQLMTLDSAVLTSAEEIYTVRCTVTNNAGLSDSKSVQARLAAEDAEYITLKLYEPDELTRSGSNVVTLIQASVDAFSSDSTSGARFLIARQVNSSSGATAEAEGNTEDAPEDSSSDSITILWVFKNITYTVGGDDDPTSPGDDANENLGLGSNVTGPTQFGLEFNIAQKDLTVGTHELRLIAFITDKTDVRAETAISIVVVESALIAQINEGFNGTLALSSQDINLSGALSHDPDVLDGEGDLYADIEYSWISCQKSLSAAFKSEVEDCASILPSAITDQAITVPADVISEALLDTGDDPDSTYFEFGLLVSKGNRSSEAYTRIEMVTDKNPNDEQIIPSLAGISVTDASGNMLQLESISSLDDLIILPLANEGDAVQWSFDMVQAKQKHLFTRNGVLKSGSSFASRRGDKGNLALGFNGGTLKPETEYAVSVSVSTTGGSIENEYEVAFKTLQIPRLTCSPPTVSEGIVSETKFTLSASLSFESSDVEYCFFLVSSTNKRIGVGKGCSAVPVASFMFHAIGEYGIECVAKTTTGAELDKVILDDKIIVSALTAGDGETAVTLLQNRLTKLGNEVDRCEAVRNHRCIQGLISVAADITQEVQAATEEEQTPESIALLDAAREYITLLSTLSRDLAKKTVYHNNNIGESIQLSLSLAQVPGDLIDSDDVVFNMLVQTAFAVDATEGDSAPVVSNEAVDQLSGLANLTMSSSQNIAQGGTSRRRLLQNAEVTRKSYAVVMNEGARFVAQMRMQQESCGYEGTESTEYPSSLEGSGQATTSAGLGLEPVIITIKVSCTPEQIAVPMVGNAVTLNVCKDMIPARQPRRFAVSLIEQDPQQIYDTGLFNSVDISMQRVAKVTIEGPEFEENAVPEGCMELTARRRLPVDPVTEYSKLVGGRLLNVPSLKNDACTAVNCLNFNRVEGTIFTNDSVIIKTSQVGLFVAGNLTDPDTTRNLDGTGKSNRGILARGLVVGAVLFVAAIMGVWLGVSTCGVVSAPDAPFSTQWEYVERDIFGRGFFKDADGTDSKRKRPDEEMLPSGARAPEAVHVSEQDGIHFE